MKKKVNDTRKTQKLMLHTETLRNLNEQEIRIVVGGSLYSCYPTDGLACPHI